MQHTTQTHRLNMLQEQPLLLMLHWPT